MSAETHITAVLADAGAWGRVHARVLATGRELAVGADEPVAAASVIKILFAIAFAREVQAGRLDPREPVEVPAELRLGGSGTSGFADPAVLSLRDLALSMMTVSDNAATDIVLARVGRETVNALIEELGLTDTHVRHDMTSGAARVAAELGFPDAHDLDAQLAAADPNAVRALAWMDPAYANATTPRDVTTLLSAIWTDRAGPAAACAFVRDAMAQQVSAQRIASGFSPEVAVAVKSGTLPGIRNEAGVVTLPDGRQFAVTVFTRTDRLTDRDASLDAAIGEAAAYAVGELSAP